MDNFSYNQIVEEFKSLEQLTPKEKYKKLPTIAFHASQALEKSNNLEEIAFYVSIFKRAGENRLLNRAKQKEFELKGISEIKTIKTQEKDVQIESGLIGVGDPTLAHQGDYDQGKIIDLIKTGRFFCVGTGGDGTFGAILRLVDASEPLANPKEYKNIISNSSIATIEIKSGNVKCADFFDVGRSDIDSPELEVPNGFYNVCFYLKELPKKFFGFVIVLSKTNKINSELSELKEIETLG